jgi:hypothetical protein
LTVIGHIDRHERCAASVPLNLAHDRLSDIRIEVAYHNVSAAGCDGVGYVTTESGAAGGHYRNMSSQLHGCLRSVG